MRRAYRFSLYGFIPDYLIRRRTLRLALAIIFLLSFTALFASLLCNDKPLYVSYKGTSLFPAISMKGFADVEGERVVYSTVNWQELKKDKVIWCPVVYAPGKSDWLNAPYKSPFDVQYKSESGKIIPATAATRHWLGTTKTGADVLSGIVHGARVSLTIGIFSMIIAGLLGTLLGALAGFFGDHRIMVSRAGLIMAILTGLPLSYFYGIHIHRSELSGLFTFSIMTRISYCIYVLLIMAFCIFLTYLFGKYIGKIFRIRAKSFLHIDQIVSRGIEIFNSIPRIVLIITLSAVTSPSVMTLVLIIGFTSWTEIARLVRAEMLRVRASEYIQSAEASGIKTARQIFRHALPNVMIPAITAITLGIASAILIESALSFLGVGVPADVVTWGSLLNEGRQNFSAWWLVIFPGAAIFLTVTSINIFGDALGELMDVKKR